MSQCRVCGRKTDGFICWSPCTEEIREVLRNIPRDVADLRAVETRQASGPLGLGDPRRGWDGAPNDGARPVTQWQYAPGAADQLWVVGNTLSGWIRHLCESRSIAVPVFAERIGA